jgi:hypothetical protein
MSGEAKSFAVATLSIFAPAVFPVIVEHANPFELIIAVELKKFTAPLSILTAEPPIHVSQFEPK